MSLCAQLASLFWRTVLLMQSLPLEECSGALCLMNWMELPKQRKEGKLRPCRIQVSLAFLGSHDEIVQQWLYFIYDRGSSHWHL